MQEYEIQIETLRGLLGAEGLLLRCDYDACDVLWAGLWLVVEETVKFGKVTYPPIVAKSCANHDDAVSLACRYEALNERMARRGFSLLHAYEVWHVVETPFCMPGSYLWACISDGCPHVVEFSACDFDFCKRRNLLV